MRTTEKQQLLILIAVFAVIILGESVFARCYPTENLETKGDRIDQDELKAHASQLPIAVGLSSRLLDVVV